MVSTRLGKEIEKNVFLFNITSVGQRKNCEFPWGIEPWTLEFCFPMLYHWATETSWWARPLQSSQKICVLLITRISNVNGIMFCKQNKKIAVCHVWTSYWAFLTTESQWLCGRASGCGIWSSKVQLLIGSQNFFLVPCLWQDEEHLSYLILYNGYFTLKWCLVGIPLAKRDSNVWLSPTTGEHMVSF